MAVILNASTTAGLVTSADTSGNLDLQAGGVTKIAVTSAGVAVTGLSKASLPTGSVLQVVNATYNTQVSTASSSGVTTGLTASITPTSATSKILVNFSVAGIAFASAAGNVYTDLYRNGSAILTNTSGSQFTGVNVAAPEYTISATYLDSPATTSSTSYTVYFRKGGGGADVAYAQIYNEKSTITLMEIAA